MVNKSKTMSNKINKNKIEDFEFPEWVTYTQAMELIKEMKRQFLNNE